MTQLPEIMKIQSGRTKLCTKFQTTAELHINKCAPLTKTIVIFFPRISSKCQKSFQPI